MIFSFLHVILEAREIVLLRQCFAIADEQSLGYGDYSIEIDGGREAALTVDADAVSRKLDYSLPLLKKSARNVDHRPDGSVAFRIPMSVTDAIAWNRKPEEPIEGES